MKTLRGPQAVSELLFATLFWGFGYVATVWSLDLLSPLGISFYRFFIASIFGLFVISTGLLSNRLSKLEYLRLAKLSMWPGLFLAVLLVSQTWGLKYTTAINSSFITAMYVVFTPIVEWIILRQKVHWSFLIFLGLSLCGVYLILAGPLQFSESSWIGDLLTLICALFSAFHIVYVGLVWNKIQRPFLFHSLQSLWAAAFILPLFLIEVYLRTDPNILGFSPSGDLRSWLSLISLVLGSTVLAFFLQIRAQSILSPSLTSLICLVESPLALIFALLLLGESIGWLSGMGAVLIFFSALGASMAEAYVKKRQTEVAS